MMDEISSKPRITLQWRDVNIKSLQITGNWTVYLTAYNKENIKISTLLALG